jgi:hypothetical protein
MEIERGLDFVRVHQATYASKVLRKLGMDTCKPSKTPMPTDWTAADGPSPGAISSTMAAVDFSSALGALGYLATRTMPWLLYAFGALGAARCSLRLSLGL